MLSYAITFEFTAKVVSNLISTIIYHPQVCAGGNAEKAGIQTGDVIVRLSGTFDEVVDVAGLGIDKIKSLVAGRAEGSTLRMCGARGSDVMERHEMALVELCIIGDDAETNDCINKIYADYDFIVDDGAMAVCEEDDGTECLIDSIWDTWSEGVVSAAINGADDEMKEEETDPELMVFGMEFNSFNDLPNTVLGFISRYTSALPQS